MKPWWEKRAGRWLLWVPGEMDSISVPMDDTVSRRLDWVFGTEHSDYVITDRSKP
jgi:hypothetical protein